MSLGIEGSLGRGAALRGHGSPREPPPGSAVPALGQGPTPDTQDHLRIPNPQPEPPGKLWIRKA